VSTDSRSSRCGSPRNWRQTPYPELNIPNNRAAPSGLEPES